GHEALAVGARERPDPELGLDLVARADHRDPDLARDGHGILGRAADRAGEGAVRADLEGVAHRMAAEPGPDPVGHDRPARARDPERAGVGEEGGGAVRGDAHVEAARVDIAGRDHGAGLEAPFEGRAGVEDSLEVTYAAGKAGDPFAAREERAARHEAELLAA